MPILATRGCPYQCTYCANPGMWTNRWYARDPKDVVAEMASYKRDALARITAMYSAWHEAEPAAGHDAQLGAVRHRAGRLQPRGRGQRNTGKPSAPAEEQRHP